jgi:predicted membrane protein
MQEPRGSQIQPRLVIGLVILALGAILALESTGVVDFHIRWRDYWPVVLIVIGLTHVLRPRRHRTGGYVLLFLGCWFLARNLFFWNLDHLFFPFLLLIVGAALVLGSLSGGGRRRPWGGSGVDGSATLHPFAILGGARAASSSQELRGGSATAILGSCVLDLRQASLLPGEEAVVDAVAFWGGVVILVPETWSVALHGMPLLGSFQDFTRPPAGGSTQRLVVRGLALMGGVEVRNRREREEIP